MKSVYRIFIFTEIFIYIAYMTSDMGILSLPSVTLKYISIILCFAFSSFAAVKRRTRDSILVAAAMLFTLISDTFLLVTDTHITFGLVTFCCVQLLYLFRIDGFGKKMWISLFVRIFTSTGVCVFLGYERIFDINIALAVFYFIGLVLNFAESTKHAILRRDKRFAVFSVGLILFLCCDICVALHNMGAYISVPAMNRAVAFANIGMWLFYLPSQVLIVLSAITGEINR